MEYADKGERERRLPTIILVIWANRTRYGQIWALRFFIIYITRPTMAFNNRQGLAWSPVEARGLSIIRDCRCISWGPLQRQLVFVPW